MGGVSEHLHGDEDRPVALAHYDACRVVAMQRASSQEQGCERANRTCLDYLAVFLPSCASVPSVICYPRECSFRGWSVVNDAQYIKHEQSLPLQQP